MRTFLFIALLIATIIGSITLYLASHPPSQKVANLHQTICQVKEVFSSKGADMKYEYKYKGKTYEGYTSKMVGMTKGDKFLINIDSTQPSEHVILFEAPIIEKKELNHIVYTQGVIKKIEYSNPFYKKNSCVILFSYKAGGVDIERYQKVPTGLVDQVKKHNAQKDALTVLIDNTNYKRAICIIDEKGINNYIYED